MANILLIKLFIHVIFKKLNELQRRINIVSNASFPDSFFLQVKRSGKPVKPVYPVATLEKLDLFRSMEVLFSDFL